MTEYTTLCKTCKAPGDPRAGEADLLFGPAFDYNPILATGLTLYSAGLNVIPIRRERRADGKKRGYRGWQRFRTTRVHMRHAERLFHAGVNIAVMTGHTSGHLVALDCENETTLMRHLRAVTTCGLPHWAWKSGGPKGGGCILLRCADGDLADIPASHADGEAGQLEVWASGTRYVVCPPSVHPSTGALYEWIEGHTPADGPLASATLTQIQAVIPDARLNTRARRHDQADADGYAGYLSQRTVDFLRNGAAVGERNERLFAAACDIYGCECAGDALDFERLWSLLETRARLCDDPVHSFTADEIERTIRSARSETRMPARMAHTDGARTHDWQRALTFAERRAWPGRTGQTDRAAFLALCERARLSSGGSFRASVREVAAIARMRSATALNALRRLNAQGLIHHVGQDKVSGANLYRFDRRVFQHTQERDARTPTMRSRRYHEVRRVFQHTQERDARDENVTLYTLEDSVTFSSLSHKTHETAERDALGRTADLVWRKMLMLDHECFLSVSEVATLCGITIPQARRALKKLGNTRATRDGEPYGVGLVYRTANNRYQAWPADDEWLRANVTGQAAEKHERRCARFASERAERATRAYLEAMTHDQEDDEDEGPGKAGGNEHAGNERAGSGSARTGKARVSVRTRNHHDGADGSACDDCSARDHPYPRQLPEAPVPAPTLGE